MSKEIMSLSRIWGGAKFGGSPIKVLQRIPCGDRADTFCLIGVNSLNQAFGYYEKRPKSLIIRTADKAQWYLWYAEPIPHWPAIVEKSSPTEYSTYEITSFLFRTVEDAQLSLQRKVVRLATEYPPIMLELEN